MQTYSTKDYSIFKKHNSNREIDPVIVRSKMKSLKESNLLHLFPILVDKELRVIDGQHRLEAAKILGLEVFYQIGDNLKSSDIITLNNSQSKWGMDGFLNYYYSEGNINYIKLKNFMDKNKAELTLVMALFEMQKGGNGLIAFKEGKFIYPDPEKELDGLSNLSNLRQIIEYIHPKVPIPKQYLKGPGFAKAFCMFLTLRSVSFELFMKKLPYRIDKMRPCSNLGQYLEIFKEIYNFRNASPISEQDINNL